jgi:DNA invertase Pin-like site-specific DNA recombinase
MDATPPLEPAIGYVRVSMAHEETISPEVQRSANEAAAARDGCYIAKPIEELDVSGRGFGRKGVQEAITDVQNGTLVNGQPLRRVYVWKFSRFGRNAKWNAVYVDEMEKIGGRLISATEPVDARTPIGRFSRGMIWQVDEFYSDLVGENWKNAHARRRRSGLPHNGNPRFGYLYHHRATERTRCPQGCGLGTCETGYVPDAATRDHAAGMFASYIKGTSVLKIAVALNQVGLRTAAGKVWDQRAVRKYMDSGFGAGLLCVHDPACDHLTPEAALRCKRKVLIPGTHDALILPEVWQEYQRQRDSRRYLPPRVEAPLYPLSGLVRCGRCGSPMNACGMRYKGTRKPGYMYQCTKYMKSRECKGTWIARHRVEDVVVAWLFGFSESIEKAARAERGRIKVRATADLDRKRLEAQIGSYSRDLTSLAIKLARDLVPEEAYVRARDELLTGQAAAKEALSQLRPPPADTGPFTEVAVGLAAEWVTFPPDQRRAMLGEMVTRIEIQSHGKSRGSGRATIAITATWGEVYFYSI